MNKKQIQIAYNKLINEIHEMKMYDGHNTIDRYICDKCGNTIHTTYKDKGVTPFTIRCNKCIGTMYHTDTFPKTSVQSNIRVYNWYRPTLKSTLKISEGMIEHIINVGLILEKINEN